MKVLSILFLSVFGAVLVSALTNPQVSFNVQVHDSITVCNHTCDEIWTFFSDYWNRTYLADYPGTALPIFSTAPSGRTLGASVNVTGQTGFYIETLTEMSDIGYTFSYTTDAVGFELPSIVYSTIALMEITLTSGLYPKCDIHKWSMWNIVNGNFTQQLQFEGFVKEAYIPILQVNSCFFNSDGTFHDTGCWDPTNNVAINHTPVC